MTKYPNFKSLTYHEGGVDYILDDMSCEWLERLLKNLEGKSGKHQGVPLYVYRAALKLFIYREKYVAYGPNP